MRYHQTEYPHWNFAALSLAAIQFPSIDNCPPAWFQMPPRCATHHSRDTPQRAREMFDPIARSHPSAKANQRSASTAQVRRAQPQLAHECSAATLVEMAAAVEAESLAFQQYLWRRQLLRLAWPWMNQWNFFPKDCLATRSATWPRPPSHIHLEWSCSPKRQSQLPRARR